MKLFFSFLVLTSLSVSVAYSQTNEIAAAEAKLQRIQSEIETVKGLVAKGESLEIYKHYLEKLEEEKGQYEDVVKRAAKKKIEKKINSQDPVEKKSLPTVQATALDNLQKFIDESKPIEERYELIIRELSVTKEVLTGLRQSTEDESAVTKDFKKQLRAKVEQLESLKLEYELKKIQVEQNDLAEMKKTGVRVGAMFDMYYQWNFNNPSKAREDKDIPFKVYNVKHNDFTIQLAEINLLKTYKNLDFYMDVDFGEMAEINKSVTADPVTHHMGQALLRYRFSEFDNTVFTVGKFYSHWGLEVPKSIENRNYSTPFYFAMIAPFWHEGVALTKTGMGDFGAGLYLYDKTDDRVDNNDGKTYGFQLNYKTAKVSAVYNLISGPEKNSENSTKEGDSKIMHEVILTYNANAQWTFVLDMLVGKNEHFDVETSKDHSWNGVVGYIDYKTSERNSLCLRVENFNDTTSKKSATSLFSTDLNPVEPTSVFGYTLTNRYNMMNGSEIRLEYRLDTASEKIYPKDKSQYDSRQNTLTLAWLYSI